MADENKEEAKQQGIGVSVNLDTTPILYTDNIQMTTNEDGIVLNVGQVLYPFNQLRIVARIGMSRVHAKKLLAEFGRLLAMSEGQIQTGEKGKKN